MLLGSWINCQKKKKKRFYCWNVDYCKPLSIELPFIVNVLQSHFRFTSICFFLTWRKADREQHKHRKPVGIIPSKKGWASTHQPCLPRSSVTLPPYLGLHVCIYTSDTGRGYRWKEYILSAQILTGMRTIQWRLSVGNHGCGKWAISWVMLRKFTVQFLNSAVPFLLNLCPILHSGPKETRMHVIGVCEIHPIVLLCWVIYSPKSSVLIQIYWF